MNLYEYKTTISTFRTAGRDYSGDHYEARAYDPEAPPDRGGPWELVTSCAADGLIFHSWRRPAWRGSPAAGSEPASILCGGWASYPQGQPCERA